MMMREPIFTTNLMKPMHHSNLYEEIQRRLATYGLSPDKKFGQNFLCDGEVLDAMCDAAEVGPEDVVLEVGPGVGTLTERLLARGATVVAVEKDERFRPLLNAIRRRFERLEVRYGDILRLDLAEVAAAYRATAARLKVVANIPYYVTGALVQQVLRPTGFQFQSVTMLVQREVAHNMLAAPGHMSLLGLSVRLVGAPQLVVSVPASAFVPPPKVASAVVHITALPTPLVSPALEPLVFRIAKACFVGKRKQVHNTLAAGLGLSAEAVTALLHAAGVPRDARPQHLTEHDFIRLAEAYEQLYSA